MHILLISNSKPYFAHFDIEHTHFHMVMESFIFLDWFFFFFFLFRLFTRCRRFYFEMNVVSDMSIYVSAQTIQITIPLEILQIVIRLLFAAFIAGNKRQLPFATSSSESIGAPWAELSPR